MRFPQPIQIIPPLCSIERHGASLKGEYLFLLRQPLDFRNQSPRRVRYHISSSQMCPGPFFSFLPNVFVQVKAFPVAVCKPVRSLTPAPMTIDLRVSGEDHVPFRFRFCPLMSRIPMVIGGRPTGDRLFPVAFFLQGLSYVSSLAFSIRPNTVQRLSTRWLPPHTRRASSLGRHRSLMGSHSSPFNLARGRERITDIRIAPS